MGELTRAIDALQALLRAHLAGTEDGAALSGRADQLIEFVETTLAGHHDRTPVELKLLLAQVHLVRFQQLPEGEDAEALMQSLQWYRELLRSAPDRVPEDISILLASMDAEAAGVDPAALDDGRLDAAIDDLTRAVRIGDIDDKDRHWGYVSNLAAHLCERFERRGDQADLYRAVEVVRPAVQVSGLTPDVLHGALTNLATALLHAYQLSSDTAALDEAIAYASRVVDGRGTTADLSNAAMAHLTRFEATNDPADLTIAVRLGERAAGAAGSVNTDPMLLSNLAALMWSAAEKSGDGAVLDEAVRLAELAVNFSGSTDPALPMRLTNLSLVLATRFDRTTSRDDIDRAVDLAREAVQRGGDIPGRPGRASNLALVLRTRAIVFGEVHDLIEAMEVGTGVAEELPAGHADRSDLLHNAAGTAMLWFDWTGDLRALDEAVRLGQAAVEAAGSSSSSSGAHNDLAICLLTRWEATRDIADLNAAVSHAELAVQEAGQDAGVIELSNLALVLRSRFEATADDHDLERALSIASLAHQRAPSDRTESAQTAMNLSLCLSLAGRTGAALDIAREAVQRSVVGTAVHAACAATLAQMLSSATSQGGPRADGWWQVVADSAAAPVSLRAEALTFFAESAMDNADAALAARRYRELVTLLPAVAWHGIDAVSRLRRLAPINGTASDAGAAMLTVSTAADALALIDQARSQLWGREIDANDGMSALERTHPTLARRLAGLRQTRKAVPYVVTVEEQEFDRDLPQPM